MGGSDPPHPARAALEPYTSQVLSSVRYGDLVLPPGHEARAPAAPPLTRPSPGTPCACSGPQPRPAQRAEACLSIARGWTLPPSWRMQVALAKAELEYAQGAKVREIRCTLEEDLARAASSAAASGRAPDLRALSPCGSAAVPECA